MIPRPRRQWGGEGVEVFNASISTEVATRFIHFRLQHFACPARKRSWLAWCAPASWQVFEGFCALGVILGDVDGPGRPMPAWFAVAKSMEVST